MLLQAVVSGRVQRVGFRYFVEEAANDLGLFGWVSNRPDGSVEVEAEGDEEDLRKLVERLKQGPSFARVDAVSPVYSHDARGYTDFEIRV